MAFGSQPAVADLRLAAGHKSIIFANTPKKSNSLRKASSGNAWERAAGWPQTLPNYSYSSPAVADLEGDSLPEFVIGYGCVDTSGACSICGHGGVRAFRRNGTQLWDRKILALLPGRTVGEPFEDPVVRAPAIGDVAGDGMLEVAYCSLDHRLRLVKAAEGTNQTGCPMDVQDTTSSIPALFDVDGHGKLETIASIDRDLTNGGRLLALRPDGTDFPGFPKEIDRPAHSSCGSSSVSAT